MATNLTPQAVRKSWDDLIDSGELILGEPCSPYTITRYSTKEGKTISSPARGRGPTIDGQEDEQMDRRMNRRTEG